jgi:polysaccharide export outer membrane protein
MSMRTHSSIRRHTNLALTIAAVLAGLATPAAAAAQTPQRAASASTAAPVRADAVITSDYVLTVGDKLRIEVYKDTQLSQSLQIRPDGKITLPLIGDAVAAGLTPAALDESLTKSLKDYITNPVVTVIVVEATPLTVYVMGEVNTPGPVALRPGMTALEALALAGGFKDFAKQSDIRIIRRGASGEPIHFNYKDAIKGDARPVALKPGDTIVVP